VEIHARGYKRTLRKFADATALRRGGSRSQLQKNVEEICGCHGLAPWRLTLIAKAQEFIAKNFKRETPRRKAVASSRVVPFFCSGERETPRRGAVAFSRVVLFFVAASVKLHGARAGGIFESCAFFF